MKILKKAAVALAAVSLVASPVVASAASAVDLRALSATEEENDIGLGLGLLVAAVIATTVVVVADGNSP